MASGARCACERLSLSLRRTGCEYHCDSVTTRVLLSRPDLPMMPDWEGSLGDEEDYIPWDFDEPYPLDVGDDDEED